jgi:hypothetical protein
MPTPQPVSADKKMTGSERRSERNKKDGLTVVIQNLNLPGVSDVNDFVAALQTLVVEHA